MQTAGENSRITKIKKLIPTLDSSSFLYTSSKKNKKKKNNKKKKKKENKNKNIYFNFVYCKENWLNLFRTNLYIDGLLRRLGQRLFFYLLM